MNILEIKNLHKSYGDLEVLKGIDLEIEKGDFFALLGHNGAGKTTIIGILTNLVTKNSGKIFVNNIDIDKDFGEARQYIGVVPQEFNFDIFTKVEDICLIQAGYYGVDWSEAKKRAEYYLKKLGLWEKRGVKARQLSGGMKRRLMIVRALMHKPKLLILDEPTAGVDVELRNSMWEFIRELNKSGVTILLTTHYLEEVEMLSDKVAILSDGKIVKNSSVKDLIKTLQVEIFIFDTLHKIGDFSQSLEKYSPKKVDSNSFELSIKKEENLNDVFSILSNEKIEVMSFRNKSNRLEQLFISLTKK